MRLESLAPAEGEYSQPHSATRGFIGRNRWLIIFVILPTLIAAIYNGLYASDIYISESQFVIKSADQRRGQISTLASLIQTTGLSSGQEQANEVLAYVRSRDALRELEKSVRIRDKYALDSVDLFSRFPGIFGQNTFEELYKFYGSMIEVGQDGNTGTAIIRVKSFDPKDAYQINARLLQLSEAVVNRLNDRAQGRAIGEAQRQVDLATERAKAARVMIARYRNVKEVIDPVKQVGGVLDISNKLVAERAALKAQLDLIERMTPRNPAIPALRDRIAAISAQIASQDSRLVGNDRGIASKIGDYENLLVEQEFATAALNAANAALVQARAEAQKQQFYLERVVEPNQPDAPLLPHRLLNTMIVAGAAICLYFIAWMFIVGILEHAPED